MFFFPFISFILSYFYCVVVSLVFMLWVIVWLYVDVKGVFEWVFSPLPAVDNHAAC